MFTQRCKPVWLKGNTVKEDWISISTYARTRMISVQAVSQQIKRPAYKALWDAGHIKKEGHGISLDADAVAALDEGRPAKVVVERVQQTEEMDTLRQQNESLRQELLEIYRELSSLKDRQLQLTDQSRQIEDMTLQISTLNSQVETKEQERTELNDRLVTVESHLETAEQEKQTLSNQLSEAQSEAAAAKEERQKISEELQTAREQAAGEQERMSKEIEELRIQLDAEKNKPWWKKLLGK